MNDLLQQLRGLTEVDHALTTVRDQLARYPALLKQMDEAESRQQQAMAAAKSELESARRDRLQAEKEVKVLQERIKKYLSQQTSVKTNKEYEAISNEIATLRTKIDEWDTQGLEKLEAEEASTARGKAAADQLTRLQSEHEGERQRIKGQIEEKQERLQRLLSEKTRRMALLPEAWRESYDLLNQKYPGSACVPLEGENCGGCHWSQVANVCQQVRRGEEVVRCEHCRRILLPPA